MSRSAQHTDLPRGLARVLGPAAGVGEYTSGFTSMGKSQIRGAANAERTLPPPRSRMRKSVILLAAVPLLAACASVAPTREPNIATPAQFEAQVPPGPAIALDQWWTAYGDAQLEKLIAEAFANGPDGRTLASRLIEARATYYANRATAFPTGNVSANGTRTDTHLVEGPPGLPTNIPGFSFGGVSENINAAFDVSWELDLFGRVRTANRALRNDYAANVFNIEGARAALAANIADSLFSARGLTQQLADAQENARISRELYKVATTRAERGFGSVADARRLNANVAQSAARALALESDLRSARRSLLILVGRGTDPLDTLLVPAELGLAPSPPATVPGQVLARRPDVREAEARLKVAAGKLRYDELAFFPKFTILPGVGLNRSEQPGFGGPITTSNWSVGVGFSAPVLDIPRLLAEYRVSGARAEQAVIAYERAVQTAYGEADSALVALSNDRNRVTLLDAGEQDARAAYDAAIKRYDLGLDGLTELLSAEQAWRDARSAAVAGRVQALRRSVQTFKALGGGWNAPGAPAV